MSIETINILETMEIIQILISVLFYIMVGLGIISIIFNIIRKSIIRILLSMILVAVSMIVNIIAKFLTFDFLINSANFNSIRPAIILLAGQIIICILLMIITFKKKKIKY